jgi:hypothetical protein
LPLIRTDGTSVGQSQGAKLPKGTVKLAIKGGTQSFTIDADNLAGPYAKGLFVFIGDAPQITNATLLYVDVLSRTGTNNHWHLALESFSGAPAQLGVTNLTDLVGLMVFVASETNKAILRANVTDLVPNPAQLSYRRRVPLLLPGMPLSQKAKGSILVSYNGRTGGSVCDVIARGLNVNNRYLENNSVSNCVAEGFLAVKGQAHWKSDTARGDELFYVQTANGVVPGSDIWLTTIMDYIGAPIVIQDCLGGVHLTGEIPSPK